MSTTSSAHTSGTSSELAAAAGSAPLDASNVVKMVVVGDGTVGKTCLCIVYKDKIFPQQYVPTVFESHMIPQAWKGKEIQISLWDTAGQEDFKDLRRLIYPGTNVFLVCFSLDSRISFDNLKNNWLPELNALEGKVHKLLVGTKSDLKTVKKGNSIRRSASSRNKPITESDVINLVRDFKLAGYIECSAKLGEASVNPVFEKAAKIWFEGADRHDNAGCCPVS